MKRSQLKKWESVDMRVKWEEKEKTGMMKTKRIIGKRANTKNGQCSMHPTTRINISAHIFQRGEKNANQTKEKTG